jgi:hypothetical protein
VFVACWSAKGGVGTTVVATALALVLSRSSPSGSLLADLSGDTPAVLGVDEPADRGLVDWLRAGPSVPADALPRLELEVGPGLGLLPRGRGPLTCSVDRGQVLAAMLAADPRPVVADCGRLDGDTAGRDVVLALAAGATHSLLVTRACYLGLRRAAAAPLRPSGVVLLTEPGRSLGRADVEQVVGAPVRAEIAIDPAVARAVDAGVFSTRLPRGLERALRYAA